MKMPKAVITLSAVFTVSLLSTGVFLWTAIRRHSVFSGIAAMISAASSLGIASIFEDYCRAASFSPREYFDVDRVINDFFVLPYLTSATKKS